MGGSKPDTGAQERTGEQERQTLKIKKELEKQAEIRQRREERDIAGIVGREASKQYETGLEDFLRTTSEQPKQITRLQQLIREQALPEQQRAMEQGRVALQQQGVRGPEAAILLQQQANALQRDLATRAEQVALQQALQDRQAQQQFAMQRAMQTLPKALQKDISADQIDAAQQQEAEQLQLQQQQEQQQKESIDEKLKTINQSPDMLFDRFEKPGSQKISAQDLIKKLDSLARTTWDNESDKRLSLTNFSKRYGIARGRLYDYIDKYGQ